MKRFVALVDCTLSDAYGHWSECSVTCGNGFRVRQRIVFSPERNGGTCDILNSRSLCTMDPCKSRNEITFREADSSGKT